MREHYSQPSDPLLRHFDTLLGYAERNPAGDQVWFAHNLDYPVANQRHITVWCNNGVERTDTWERPSPSSRDEHPVYIHHYLRWSTATPDEMEQDVTRKRFNDSPNLKPVEEGDSTKYQALTVPLLCRTLLYCSNPSQMATITGAYVEWAREHRTARGNGAYQFAAALIDSSLVRGDENPLLDPDSGVVQALRQMREVRDGETRPPETTNTFVNAATNIIQRLLHGDRLVTVEALRIGDPTETGFVERHAPALLAVADQLQELDLLQTSFWYNQMMRDDGLIFRSPDLLERVHANLRTEQGKAALESQGARNVDIEIRNYVERMLEAYSQDERYNRDDVLKVLGTLQQQSGLETLIKYANKATEAINRRRGSDTEAHLSVLRLDNPPAVAGEALVRLLHVLQDPDLPQEDAVACATTTAMHANILESLYEGLRRQKAKEIPRTLGELVTLLALRYPEATAETLTDMANQVTAEASVATVGRRYLRSRRRGRGMGPVARSQIYEPGSGRIS